MNTFWNQYNQEGRNPGNSNGDRDDERDEGATPERGEKKPEERGDYEDITGDREEE